MKRTHTIKTNESKLKIALDPDLVSHTFLMVNQGGRRFGLINEKKKTMKMTHTIKTNTNKLKIALDPNLVSLTFLTVNQSDKET